MDALTGRERVMGSGFGMVLVPVQITFGASGAVSATDTPYGSVTVTQAATGRYTFVFSGAYTKLMGLMAAHDYQTLATDGQWQVYEGYVASTKTVELSHVVAAAEVNPASGDTVDITFCMQNTNK